jgi:hypothetical protein
LPDNIPTPVNLIKISDKTGSLPFLFVKFSRFSEDVIVVFLPISKYTGIFFKAPLNCLGLGNFLFYIKYISKEKLRIGISSSLNGAIN